MRRREFVAGVSAAAIAWPGSAHAQQALKTIGFVSWGPPSSTVRAEELRKGLHDLGYVEGRDVRIEAHFTDGNRERTREVLQTLVQNGADVLVVSATPAIQVAREVTRTVPIVMAPVSDPIAPGFAESLARPGGNLTGLSMFGPVLAGKRIELLKEIRPGLRTIAFLGSAKDINTPTFVRGTQAEADRNGLTLAVHLVEGPDRIDAGLFEAMRREGAEAVIVQPIFTGHQKQIVDLARMARLPVISDYSVFAEAGAVLAFGADNEVQMRRAAYFVDRILKGENPGDLPIEQPTKLSLVVNTKAAEQFDWAIPPSVIARADEVIE